MSFISRLLKIFFALVLLVIIAAVVLVLTFDPNKYKPEIIDAAARNQVLLSIDGDLSWQLWPQLGIKAEAVAVAAPKAPKQIIASFSSFAVLIEAMPLLRKEVVIDGISLDGANINLEVDKNGLGNWQSLGKVAQSQPQQLDDGYFRYASANAADAQQHSNGAAGFDVENNLKLKRLVISNSKLHFSNAAGLDLQLDKLGAELDELALNGTAFPISLSTDFILKRPEASTLQGNTHLKTDLKVPAKLDLIEIVGLRAPTQLHKGSTIAELEVSANAVIELGRKTGAAITYKGDIELAPANIQKLMIAMGTPLPAMAGKTALHKVALQSPFTGNDKSLTLAPLTLQLDDTNISGSAGIADFESFALVVDINGDNINLDNYLAPPEVAVKSGSSGKKKAAAKPASADDALPLEALRGLNLGLKAGFDRLSVKGLQFTQVKSRVQAAKGLINLQSFDALLHDGPLNASAVFDARKDVATLTYKATGEKMPLEKLLADFDVDPLVAGQGGVVATGGASGATSTALADSFFADVNLTSSQLLLQKINLERSMCQLAMNLQRKPMPQINWSDSTKLKAVQSKLRYSNQKLTIENINSGVESMAMAGLGLVDLAKQSMDFKFNLRIDDAANKLLNCPLANNSLLNRDIPIRCKDTFAKLGATSCVPDMAIIEDMYRDQVKGKLNKELEKQLEKNPEVKDLLKGLFGGKKKGE